MTNQFFEQPILNSPYDYPTRHWELDSTGQPTQEIEPSRRRADFITPIPRPRKRKGGAGDQASLTFDEGRLKRGSRLAGHDRHTLARGCLLTRRRVPT